MHFTPTSAMLAAALSSLGIYKVTVQTSSRCGPCLARSSVLHEMIVTAVEQDLELRVNEAVVLQTLVAERRAA